MDKKTMILSLCLLSGGGGGLVQAACPSWPAYLEPKAIASTASGSELAVTFTLTDIPATLSFNRFAPGPVGVLEYNWTTFIDVDGNPATGSAARSGADFQLVAGHQVDSSSGGAADTPLASALNFVKVLQWQPMLGIFLQSDSALATVDATANTIAVKGKIPGLGSQSRYVFQAESYDGTTLLTNYNPVVPPAPCEVPAQKFAIENGIIPPENVTVTATGTNDALTVVADLKLADLVAANAFSASRYNVYLAAMVPGEKVGASTGSLAWFQKPKSNVWQALTSPIGAYLENVEVSSQDQRVRIEVVRDTNLSSLVGAEIYIGYGTSDTEMLQSRRYRGIYKVQ